MIIKEIKASSVKDSRGKDTIKVSVKTDKRLFVTMAPSGKSTGKFEVKSYGSRGLSGDIEFINSINRNEINALGIEKFEDLIGIEKLVDWKNGRGKIGGNSLFALEASILKAAAKEKGVELFELIGGKKKGKSGKIIRPMGNTIGGGLHSKGIGEKRPDFQEFLFISDGKNVRENIKINRLAYRFAGSFLKKWRKKRNDEGALETDLSNEQVLQVMSNVRKKLETKYGYKTDIGLDIAAASFYKNSRYYYENPHAVRTKKEQVNYLADLIERFNIYSVEDPFDEDDFSSFRELKGKVKNCLIVGDDLTTTNPERLKKAVRMRSINAIIVKPNQIGSLLRVREVIDICKKQKIKTIISHRSGETIDNTIADLGVGFGVDFIKTGTYGKVRVAKLRRLVKIC